MIIQQREDKVTIWVTKGECRAGKDLWKDMGVENTKRRIKKASQLQAPGPTDAAGQGHVG